MLIAVMSDTHDQIENVRWAVKEIKAAGCEMIFHCGDFVAPFMLVELDAAGMPVHGVFGNNDGDQYLLTRNSLTRHNHITLHGQFGEVEADGCRIAFLHDGTLAEDIAGGGRLDMVLYGHFHVYSQKTVGHTLLLNPGEMLGKDSPPGFCLVDTKSREVSRKVREL